MATKRRSEVFRSGEQAVVHVMNRCVRKCFLMGDQDKPKNSSEQPEYGHRRRMFEKELEKAAGGFGIDLLSYAIMDNHFHLILRSRPDVVLLWDDETVVKQWHKLCPLFKDENGFPVQEPVPEDLAKAQQDSAQVATWRSRLSDISWFMKLVSERIARWCNALDDINGHFWQGRYKSILLLDEQALLACSMYVDLNRIKAELASSLETSDYTSIQRRLQAFANRMSIRRMLAVQIQDAQSNAPPMASVCLEELQSTSEIPDAIEHPEPRPDAHLAPVHIDEKNHPIGPHLSHAPSRCSDKGFLPMTQEKYVELLRWTTDQLRRRHKGQTLEDCPQELIQRKLDAEVWCKLVTQFSDMFFAVAGMPDSVDNQRSHTGKRFHMPHKTRELLTT